MGAGYASAMTQVPDDEKTPLRGAALTQLYPTPKTLEERRQEQRERDERQRHARAKRPAFSAALLITSVPFGAVLAYILLWTTGLNAISTLFFTALAGMLGGLIIWAIASRILNIWQQWELTAWPLLIGYAVLAGPIISVLVQVSGLVSGTTQRWAVAAVLHFIIVYAGARLVMALQQRYATP